ncbi:MAG: DUF3450 domain-containing protein [Gammaproteobacteria bacterium]|nr:DUF3450 domain-containing protein [Gammaproteobacteria bacterium]
MSNSINRKLITAVGGLCALFAVTASQAAPEDVLKTTVQTQQQTNTASARSQARVDQVSDETQNMLAEYLVTTQQTDRLRVYNQQLEKLIRDQEEEKISIRKQLEDVEVVEKEILPLMIRMVDSLEKFVKLDMPFLLEERTNRVLELKDMLDKANVTVSEKYRRVMEAYSTETEYGRTIEAYRGLLPLGEGGEDTNVDILRVGRVLLAYQTTDRENVGFWNKATGQWQELPSDYNDAISDGLRIARKQMAPELMTLPVSAPESAK